MVIKMLLNKQETSETLFNAANIVRLCIYIEDTLIYYLNM